MRIERFQHPERIAKSTTSLFSIAGRCSIPTASTTSQFSSQLSYDTILLDGKGKTIVASA